MAVLHLQVQGTTFLSGISGGCWHASSAAKFGLPWPFIEHALLSGQADIGAVQAHYQRINSTVSSFDLHFIMLACQHGSASLHLICLNTNSSPLSTQSHVHRCKNACPPSNPTEANKNRTPGGNCTGKRCYHCN